ncbi:hypothetical protein AB0J01_28220 [Streptomyces sp. NPDC050204]|uniref:hypothetical protein n=1 Tax=Streptomyces sp. NPDC050204 TaxID=3155514 RepID=UPI0034201AEB
MTVAIAEPVALHLDVTEFDRITCDECDKASPFLDDGDDGTHDAHDAGWHVLNNDECGCPNLCRDCAEDLCGAAAHTPRGFAFI